MGDERWNEAIDAAVACSREKNWASPGQIRRLIKGDDQIWDAAINAAANLGTHRAFASPEKIATLRRAKST